MKIVITNRLPQEGIEPYKKQFEIIQPEEKSFDKKVLLEELATADILLSIFSYKIDKEIIDAAPNLKLIANYGVGFNNVDIVYARSKGIPVTNTPISVVEPTAELAFGLMIDIARKITLNDKLTRKKAVGWGLLDNMGTTLYGKKLGIFGMGNVGRAVARRAVAFGMKAQYHNRRKVQNFDEAEYVSIDELLQNSDFLLLSAPLTNETFHFINKSSLQKMKKTAILVNIARGPLVNESDLVNALKQQIIAGAALDVYENEPIINEELMNIDNVVLSPHKGTCTIDTRIAMTQEAFKNIINFLKGDEIALVN